VANTDGDGVYLRATRRAADRIGLIPEGTLLQVLGPPEEDEGRQWLPVRTPYGATGWVPAEYTAPLED
jgi:hypothetical protein